MVSDINTGMFSPQVADLFGLMSDSSALKAYHGLPAKLDRDGALRKAVVAINNFARYMGTPTAIKIFNFCTDRK